MTYFFSPNPPALYQFHKIMLQMSSCKPLSGKDFSIAAIYQNGITQYLKGYYANRICIIPYV